MLVMDSWPTSKVSVAPADTVAPVCRVGVRVENAPEGRGSARIVTGYHEDMQLFNGPLPLPPPAFDLPPQVMSYLGYVLLSAAGHLQLCNCELEVPQLKSVSAPDMGSAGTRVETLI